MTNRQFAPESTVDNYQNVLENLVSRFQEDSEPVHYSRAAIKCQKHTGQSVLQYYEKLGLVVDHGSGLYTPKKETVEYIEGRMKNSDCLDPILEGNEVYNEIEFLKQRGIKDREKLVDEIIENLSIVDVNRSAVRRTVDFFYGIGVVGDDRNQPEAELNHVGHTVPDLEAAVDWYTEVFGFEVLVEPTTIESGSGAIATRFEDIVGVFEEVRIAQLKIGSRTGFELFEYPNLNTERDSKSDSERDNWQTPEGIHHFSITHPNLNGVVERAESNGGSQHSKIWTVDENPKCQFTYIKDPWGNFIEIYNREYTDFYD